MALDANSVILPGQGTVFVAPVGTALFTYATVDPTSSATYTGWQCLGHTSRDNAVAFSKDGGDKTALGSWWTASIRSSVAPITYGMTVNSLQVDALTLGLAFGGGELVDGSYTVKGSVVPQDRAVAVLIVDGADRAVIEVKNGSITVGDMPEFDPENFFEIQLDIGMNADNNDDVWVIHSEDIVDPIVP